MTEPSALSQPRHSPARTATIVALMIVGAVACGLLDLPVHHAVAAHAAKSETLDVMRMFRSGGYLPTWLIVAAAIALVDRAAVGRWCWAAARRATLLVTSVVVGGIAVEVAKLLFRRLRPDQSGDAWYAFRSFATKTFGSGGLSMPSSHAAVSFSAAFMLARLFPPAGWLFVCYAIGTGVSRVMADAHYVSDVYIAAIIGFGAAWGTERTISRAASRPLFPVVGGEG